MRKVLLVCAAVLTCVGVKAQQDVQVSQNDFNTMYINPGYAGMNDAICATFQGRLQNIGFDGGPQTGIFSAHAPVRLLRGGVGLSVMSESIGIMNNTIINASYAYHHTLPFGKIGAGVGFGMIQNSIDLSRGLTPDETSGGADVVLDPSLAANNKDGGFDMNFGLYFKGNTGIRAGVSTTHLTTAELTDGDQGGSVLSYEVANHWFFYGGYDYQLSNPDWVLQPRVLVKTEFSTTQVDINCKALYREMIWGGLTYRIQDAAIAMAGFQKGIGENQNLRIGLAYDITTNQLRQYSSGTVELAVNYCFKIIPKPKFQRHKTVRFL
jgi:type IX secretion system PorP/SprF family membrane protein